MPKTLSTEPRQPGDGDGLPSFFSDPHPEAVGSHGDEMVKWAEARRNGPLRWFQWLTAQRRYEFKADGTWCWPLVFTSMPRQQGKSVELTEDAAWTATTGRTRSILHAAHRVATSRAIQADLWRWALDYGCVVRKQLGDSHVVWPDDGPTWITVAMESAYGQRAQRILVDEAWAMDPEVFWSAMFPTLGAQVNPQVLFWSAANSNDKGLVAGLRQDPNVCRMEWGALPGESESDERLWHAATPFMTKDRLAVMRVALSRPGFAQEWLNVWPAPTDTHRWVSRAMTDRAAARVGDAPEDAVCAVEVSPDGRRWSVAAAWPHTRGRVRARVWDVQTAGDAARILGDRRVVSHAAVAVHPTFARRHVETVGVSQSRAATSNLRDVLMSGRLAVAGVPDDVWAGVRTIAADGGEMIHAQRSTVPVQGVKALSWAVWAVLSSEGQTSLVL